MPCLPCRSRRPPSPLLLPCSCLPSLRRYGFNSGSTQCVYGCMQTAAQIAVNTTLATGVCAALRSVSAGLSLRHISRRRCDALPLPLVLPHPRLTRPMPTHPPTHPPARPPPTATASPAAGAGGISCLFLAVFNGNPGDIGPLLNGGCLRIAQYSAAQRSGAEWGCSASPAPAAAS